MREWADATAARVLAAARQSAPRPRVLEIGCGTGMLLFRVAPACARYVGVDFSAAALAHVQSQVDAQGLQSVALQRLRADQLDAETSDSDRSRPWPVCCATNPQRCWSAGSRTRG